MRIKALLAALVMAAVTAVAATYSPSQIPDVHRADRRDFVANPDGVLSRETVSIANSMLDSMRRALTVEPMLVVVDDITDPDDASEFATELFGLWGPGKADKDNGLLILIVKDQRKATIRTGYGLEGTLPDITCGRIIRDAMAPKFREGKYDLGTLDAIGLIYNILSDPETAAEYRSDEADADDTAGDSGIDGFAIYLAISAFVALCMLASFLINLYEVRKRSDYSKYRTFADWKPVFLALSAFGLGIPLIAAIPLVLCLNHWRNHTRKCPNCGAVMRKVDEVHDNDYLTPAQDLEERIGSVDYDVWLCPDCGETDVLPYTSRTSPYIECDKCHARTARLVRTRVVERPTARSKGKGVREYECLNCHHRNDRYYDIAPEPDALAAAAAGAAILGSSRRSGGFGGGFGGGSFGGGFGGGMTGGGGATGGW